MGNLSLVSQGTLAMESREVAVPWGARPSAGRSWRGQRCPSPSSRGMRRGAATHLAGRAGQGWRFHPHRDMGLCTHRQAWREGAGRSEEFCLFHGGFHPLRPRTSS